MMRVAAQVQLSQCERRFVKTLQFQLLEQSSRGSPATARLSAFSHKSGSSRVNDGLRSKGSMAPSSPNSTGNQTELSDLI